MSTPSPTPSDELLSAYLDGELEDAEADRVQAALAADPEVVERLDALRSARQAVGAPAGPAPDPEPFIAAALREFDAAGAAGASVTPITEVAGWRARLRDPRYLAVAAALVVALAAAGAFAGSLGDDTQDQLATGAAEEFGDATADAGGGVSAESDRSASALAPESPEAMSVPGADDGTQAGGLPDLGAHASTDDLVAELERRFAENHPTGAADDAAGGTGGSGTFGGPDDAGEDGEDGDTGTGSCPSSAARDDSTAEALVVFTATLVFQDRPAVVVVFDTGGDGPFEAVVLDQEGCAVVAGFTVERPA